MIFRQWKQVLDRAKTQTRRLVKSGWDKPLPKTFRHAYYGDVEYRDVLMTHDACMFYEMKGVPFPGKGVYREWTVHYPGELGGRGDVDTFYQVRWIVGRTYAVQPGRGRKGIGRILLTDVREERLQDIDLEDVYAEGVTCYGEGGRYRVTVHDVVIELFARFWNSIYEGQPDKQWEANPKVFPLTFEVVES